MTSVLSIQRLIRLELYFIVIMAEVTTEQQESTTPVNQINESEPPRPSEDNQDTSNNDHPLKLRRKKKRHRRPKPHRDPEEIKQLRLERLNIQREVQWNNRFINDTIPNLFASKTKKKKSEPIKRNKSPLQTVYLERDVDHSKLPNIRKHSEKEEVSKNTQKSFNIRTFGGKKDAFRRVRKHHKKSIEDSKELEKSLEAKLPVKMEQMHVDKVLTKSKQPNQERLKAKLEQKTKVTHIDPHYKQLLVDLIQAYTVKPNKELKMLLQNQINSIGSPKNPYTRIDNLIKQRRQQLKSIRQKGPNATLGQYLTFQLTSVTLIEEILKFKAKWEEQYFKLETNRKIQYKFEGKNYLLSLNQEVKDLSQGDPDPFLVRPTNKLQQLVGTAMKEQQKIERKQMLLKIRACELLLIEQEITL